jgi:hypothetical protein
MTRMFAKLTLVALAAASLFYTSNAAAMRIAPREQLPTCNLPAPTPRDRILLHHARTDLVSNVALVTRDDVTNVANIVIEPGAQPLYLLLVSSHDPVIWNITGATNRISRAVLVGRYAPGTHTVAVGAVGITERIVTTHVFCDGVPALAAPRDNPYMVHVMGVLRPMLGREPEIITADEVGSSVALPSGRVTPPGPDVTRPFLGFDRNEWTEVVRFHDGHLARINPADVIGAPAFRYDVLPQEFGLAQLVGNGSLRRMPSSRPGNHVYRLRRPIARIPAGLAGAHLVKFEVPPGVPRPAGDLAHSCLVMLVSGAEEGVSCEYFRRDD